jgi:SAM-dependent methyltransferase
MKNKELWQPTKFEFDKKKRLRATRNQQMSKGGSIFIGDILANAYQRLIIEHAHGVLLDLGCGSVPLYGVYKNLIDENICIDWHQARDHNRHLDYELDLNLGIPLPDEYVDTILMTDVIEHIYNVDKIWFEMSRVLRLRGKMILGIPFLYNLHEEPFDYFRLTEYGIKHLCERNRLSVLVLEPYGGTPEVIMSMIANHLNFSRIISISHLFLAKAIVNTAISKYLSRLTARKFPLGYVIVAEKI